MYSQFSLISVPVPPLSYLGSCRGKWRPERKKERSTAHVLPTLAVLAVSVVKSLLKSSPLLYISAFLS